jgi:hypothetical protein
VDELRGSRAFISRICAHAFALSPVAPMMYARDGTITVKRLTTTRALSRIRLSSSAYARRALNRERLTIGIR